MYLPMAKDALKRNRKRVIVGVSKSGKHKFRYVNVCEKCFKDTSEVEIDHREEVSLLVNEVDRYRVQFDLGLFCEAVLLGGEAGFEILCIECHAIKTKKFMVSRSRKGNLL
jgi:hypothetical protein